MQVKTIIQEIQQLSLRKRFLIIEETLQELGKILRLQRKNLIYRSSIN